MHLLLSMAGEFEVGIEAEHKFEVDEEVIGASIGQTMTSTKTYVCLSPNQNLVTWRDEVVGSSGASKMRVRKTSGGRGIRGAMRWRLGRWHLIAEEDGRMCG